MATTPLSVRLNPRVIEALRSRAAQTGEPRSTLAQRYIEEGLRMEAHPGIIFRPGSNGRRAGLIRGPDVWQVIDVLRGYGSGDAAIQAAADWLSLDPREIRVAVRYYAAHTEEIDEWIRLNDEAADQLEAQLRREQDALG